MKDADFSIPLRFTRNDSLKGKIVILRSEAT